MAVNINELNDPAEAAKEAVKDLDAFIKAANEANGASPEIGVLGAIGLFTSIAGTVGSVAQTGIDLANLVNGGSSEDSPGSMEIILVNNTKYPIVPFDSSAKKSDLSDFADPLLPTESTTFLITYDESFVSGELGDGTSFEFSVLINDVSLDFVYYFDKHWFFGYRLTGDNSYNLFDQDTSLVGAEVTTIDTADDTAFDFFTSGIETSNGKVQLNFFSTDWD
ncbi:MAG: hypothetical protein AAFQ94_13535 [Bacteroidota bacterium]